MNEEIEALNRGIAEISDQMLHIICECGDLLCIEQLPVHVTTYEKIRSEATLFFVIPGHAKPDIEDVVEETDTYDVVRKRSSEAVRVVEETDPRA